MSWAGIVWEGTGDTAEAGETQPGTTERKQHLNCALYLNPKPVHPPVAQDLLLLEPRCLLSATHPRPVSPALPASHTWHCWPLSHSQNTPTHTLPSPPQARGLHPEILPWLQASTCAPPHLGHLGLSSQDTAWLLTGPRPVVTTWTGSPQPRVTLCSLCPLVAAPLAPLLFHELLLTHVLDTCIP